MNWFEYTLRDGTVVEIGSVVPDGPIRGQLQIAHGMVEHLGRYETWMKRLASKGYYVFGHTMRGHARVGTIQPIERGVTSETYADDVMEVKRLMEKVDVPYVLFGHSMGSFVARIYLQQNRAFIASSSLRRGRNRPLFYERARSWRVAETSRTIIC